jgi:hypothetical protein
VASRCRPPQDCWRLTTLTINNKKWGTVAGLAQRMENARGQATAIVKWPKYG